MIENIDKKLGKLEEEVRALKVILNNLDLRNKEILENIDSKVDVFIEHQQIMFWENYKERGESISEAKKRFFLNLELKDEFMEIKQKGNLILLKKLIDVCDKNELVYWLDFGSLLGAVRHKGPIPWDDDIDVCMPRSDYEKFLEIIEKDDNFMITNWYHVPYLFRITKLVYKKRPNTWFLDIFPMEESTLDECESLNIFKQQRDMFKKTLSEYQNKVISYDCFLNDNESKALEDISKDCIKKAKEEFLKKNSEVSCYVTNIDGPQDEVKKRIGYCIKTKDVFPLKKIEFAKMQVNVMNKYKNHLTCMYGDYMTLPTDIISHIHIKNKPSMEQMEEMEKFLNQNLDYNG